ncbi:hypothetical protein NLJ89_g6792 [Agrocybe chaxingu]|uniref:DUF4218 domain-containing protein n=1 Tax=Agrocybe chaxingu TaxID=84603 RepID=A0A9W8MSC2_9AGAR|nr:hypothetical protein NLJ89_g6792 [Agrocybe chaxingu]
MAPHIHSGRLVNQRWLLLPEPQLFCQCRECINYQRYDEATNEIIRGQIIPRQLWKEHQKEEQCRCEALMRLAHEKAELDSLKPPAHVSDPSQPETGVGKASKQASHPPTLPARFGNLPTTHGQPTPKVDEGAFYFSLLLTPQHTTMVVCPKCFCTYTFDPATPESFPPFCVHKKTPGSQKCGRRLRRQAPSDSPVCEFIRQNIFQWCGRMYSRPDIEKLLDEYPKIAQATNPGELKDIWDGSVLKGFVGPDGKLFLQSNRDEGHLVFGLNMDGFNPYGNREAGKKTSIGGMYLVCFNLPPECRYLVENTLLVGIIPGLNEPSTDEVNHFLRPLVDDFLSLWTTGVFLSKTPRCPGGRLVRCALIPLICDLPAARRASGLSSHSSRHLCSECNLLAEDVDNLDPETWPKRTLSDHLAHANQWKEAKTEHQRKNLVTEHGIRWSELLRLPYWDPTKHIAVDSMHGFYLRILHRHIRQVWNMDVEVEDGDGRPLFSTENKAPELDFDYAEHILRHGSTDQLAGLPLASLRHLCSKANLNYGDHPKKLVQQLRRYRITQGWFGEDDIIIPPLDGDQADSSSPSISSQQPATALTYTEFLANAYNSYSNSALRGLKKAFLLSICAIRFKKFAASDYQDLKKPEIANMLVEERIQQQAEEAPTDQEPTLRAGKKSSVLGKAMLEAIREDMSKLNLPSWTTRAPKHPGEVRWGKFKADEWKSFCLVNLPITLVRLWGSKPRESRYYKMLQNYMDLITAVKLVNLRTVTEQHISTYETCMRRYLVGLRDLYPSTPITPYQHLSLHFPDLLRRFGPTHSWRCYAFERYNGIIQHIPSNNKFGEMEKTKFKRFCQMQNLRALFSECQIPKVAQSIIETFEAHFQVDIRGTLSSETSRPRGPHSIWYIEAVQWDTKAGGSLFQSLQNLIHSLSPIAGSGYIPNRIRLLQGLDRNGQLFECRPKLNNANILFQKPGTDELAVGVIDFLFLHTRVHGLDERRMEAFAVVLEYELLSAQDSLVDPFISFPHVGGYLRYDRLRQLAILIPFKNIVAHVGWSMLVIPEIEQLVYIFYL